MARDIIWGNIGSAGIVLKGQCSRPVEASGDKERKVGWQEEKNRARLTGAHIGF